MNCLSVGSLCPLPTPERPAAPLVLMGLVLRSDPHSLLLAPVHTEVALATESDLVCAAAGNSLNVDLVLGLGLARSFPPTSVAQPAAAVSSDLVAFLNEKPGKRAHVLERRLVRGLRAVPGSAADKAQRQLSEFWGNFRASQWALALADIAAKVESPSSIREPLQELARLVLIVAGIGSQPTRTQESKNVSPLSGKGSALKSLEPAAQKTRPNSRRKIQDRTLPDQDRFNNDELIEQYLELLQQLGVSTRGTARKSTDSDFLNPLAELFALLIRLK